MGALVSGARFLYIDPSTAGISGNMLLGALLDALTPAKRAAVLKALKGAFKRKGFSVSAGEATRHGFRAFYIDASDVAVDTHDLAKEVDKATRAVGLGPRATAFAHRGVELLIDLEAEVHGEPAEHVHLHELASLDTVFDACGVALALEAIGHFGGEGVVYARPVEVGSGTVTFSHGTVPVPPPVSELLLHKFRIPFTQRGDRELATPTGLALLALLKPRFGPPPASAVVARGVGAGTRDLPDRPNVLFIQVREAVAGTSSRPVADSVAQIEVSLDDITGEAAAHAVSRAFDEGALDAHLVATTTKKGRPGHLLFVVAREEDAERIVDVLAEETGSWGVRIAHRVARVKAVPREHVVKFRVGGRTASARVKVLDQGGRPARFKVEHDDVAASAKAAGVTLAAARAAAEAAAMAAHAGRKRKGGSK